MSDRGDSAGEPEHPVTGAPASSPCYAADVDPAYLGLPSPDDLIVALNDLLEGERAGATGLNEMACSETDAAVEGALAAIARDEGRFCRMLASHIRRLGSEPTTATGAFRAKLLGKTTLRERLMLLDRGQRVVVARLDTLLADLDDAALAADLDEMRAVHVVNIERAAALLATLDA